VPGAVRGGNVGQHQARPQAPGGLLQLLLAAARRTRVGEHDIHRQGRGVLGEHLQVAVRREPLCLPRLRHQVKRHQPARGRADQRLRQRGDEQVRQDASEPRSRPEYHPVSILNSQDGLRDSRRIGRFQRNRPYLPRGRGARRLAAHNRRRLGAARVKPLHKGDDVERHGGHGQHPAGHPQQAAHQVQAGHRIAEQVPQRRDQQIAGRMAGQVPAAPEPVLHEPRPGRPPLVVAAQRR
jgi:hypothetical protein